MDRQSLIDAQRQLADQHEAEGAQHLVNAAIEDAVGNTEAAAQARASADRCLATAQARRATADELAKSNAKAVTVEQIDAAATPAAQAAAAEYDLSPE